MGARTRFDDLRDICVWVNAEEAAAGWTRWYDELRTRCVHADGEERCAGPSCTVGKRILKEDVLGGNLMHFWPEFAIAARLSRRGFERTFGTNDPRASRARFSGKVSYRRPRLVTLDADDDANGGGSAPVIAGVRVTSGELRRLRACVSRRAQSLSPASLADRMRGLACDYAY